MTALTQRDAEALVQEARAMKREQERLREQARLRMERARLICERLGIDFKVIARKDVGPGHGHQQQHPK